MTDPTDYSDMTDDKIVRAVRECDDIRQSLRDELKKRGNKMCDAMHRVGACPFFTWQNVKGTIDKANKIIAKANAATGAMGVEGTENGL